MGASRTTRFFVVLSLALPLWSQEAHAQARVVPKVSVPKPPTFFEDQPPLAHYSASDVLGVLSGSLTSRTRTSAIVVTGIRPDDRTICVNIERSNGGYIAAFTIANPGRGPTLELVMPSNIIPKLNATAGEMAVRARASRRAKACGDNDPNLVASWTRASGESVSILLNSQRATYAAVEIGGEAPVRCQRLDVALARPTIAKGSFDTVCQVRVGGACGGEQTVTVQLRDGARYRTPSPQFRLRNPCA